MNMQEAINKSNDTAKELENLQKQYEEALDAGDECKARLIQHRIDMIHKYM